MTLMWKYLAWEELMTFLVGLVFYVLQSMKDIGDGSFWIRIGKVTNSPSTQRLPTYWTIPSIEELLKVPMWRYMVLWSSVFHRELTQQYNLDQKITIRNGCIVLLSREVENRWYILILHPKITHLMDTTTNLYTLKSHQQRFIHLLMHSSTLSSVIYKNNQAADVPFCLIPSFMNLLLKLSVGGIFFTPIRSWSTISLT